MLAISAVLVAAQESRERPGGETKAQAGESGLARERGGAGAKGGGEGAGAGTAADGPKRGEREQQKAQSQPDRKGATAKDEPRRDAAPKGQPRVEGDKSPPRKSAEPGTRQRGEEGRRQADDKRRESAKDEQRAAPKDQPARKDVTRPADKDGGKAATGAGTGAGTGDTAPSPAGRPPAARQQQAERGDGRAGSLTEEQRTVIRERIVEPRAPRANLRIDLRIGVQLPRNVRLAPLPPVIVERVPAYRGYRYVLVEDEIVIVEPRTLRVVEVLERRGSVAGSRTARTSARGQALELSAADQRVVYQGVYGRVAPADLRIRLGLGVDIAESVRLEIFPREIVEQVPELSRYRFVIAERQVVVVEPETREIALLIDEP